MQNVIFLSRFTGTGINEIMEYDADFFNDCLIAAKEWNDAEAEKIYRVAIAGYEKGKKGN